MASKAEQWKRLHDLMRDPEVVYAVPLGSSTWLTDRYVLVDLAAARQNLGPEPGTWHLRASSGPAPADASRGELNPKSLQKMLGQFALLRWEPADVTPWALADGDDETWRLLVADGKPVLMSDEVVRRWPAAFPERADTVTWHVARFNARQAGSWVARATVTHDYGAAAKCDPSERVFGYLMGTRRQLEGLPPFPKLVTP
jgi:hypothetical protein